jgi:hypothetical protein
MLRMPFALRVPHAFAGMVAMVYHGVDFQRVAITREGADRDGAGSVVDVMNPSKEPIQDARIGDELTSNGPPRPLRGRGGILVGLRRHDRGGRRDRSLGAGAEVDQQIIRPDVSHPGGPGHHLNIPGLPLRDALLGDADRVAILGSG